MQIDEDEELCTHSRSSNAAETPVWTAQGNAGGVERPGLTRSDSLKYPSEWVMNIVCASCWVRGNSSRETPAAERLFPTRTS